MHWTEERKAVVEVGLELQRRGWTIHGYYAGESDPFADYWSPPSWAGVATNEKYPGVVVGVRAGLWRGIDLLKCETPSGKAWHVEKDGIIVASGIGLSKCVSYDPREAEKGAREIADAIEKAVARIDAPEADTPADDGVKFVVTHERDWTWIKFDDVPPEDVRDALKLLCGARYSGKREAWYIRWRVSREEIEAAINDDIEKFERLREARLHAMGARGMEIAAGVA